MRLVFALVVLGSIPWQVFAQQDDAVIHAVRLVDIPAQTIEVQSRFPTGGAASIELALPVWGPGFYVIEKFAENVSDFSAQGPNGTNLEVVRTQSNRWKITSSGADFVDVTYRLKCDRCSVVTNWVQDEVAVLNGPATYFMRVGDKSRPQAVQLELPADWRAFTGLESSDTGPNEFVAPDYDVLLDSPILAGKGLEVREFDVAGTKHVFVNASPRADWDWDKVVANLQALTAGMREFWGELPFRRYVFLNLFDQNTGGLEHLDSTLISTRLTGDPSRPTWDSFRWLAFVSHEYFHSFNVKRLRPVELGPFDYEHPPRTPSLWISEGLTSYYGDLIVVRSGLAKPEQFLTSMSEYIQNLQNTPGRLKQSLEQASLEVWTSGMSGVARDPDHFVSYYVKGPIVGFLLDAKIRRATDGRRSLDDVMRLAFQKYSGRQGFTPAEFVAVAETVAGIELDDWFQRHLAMAEELDYAEALEWYGLQFEKSDDAKSHWNLVARSDASEKQRAELRRLTSLSRAEPAEAK
jgi:predicted metalloprotease with PDZ domain